MVYLQIKYTNNILKIEIKNIFNNYIKSNLNNKIYLKLLIIWLL
jgi:hypothetical protein